MKTKSLASVVFTAIFLLCGFTANARVLSPAQSVHRASALKANIKSGEARLTINGSDNLPSLYLVDTKQGFAVLAADDCATPVQEWEDRLYRSLEMFGPTIYCGYTLTYDGMMSEGHTFVIDGYSSEGYFHVNWGWSGYGDGYFMLNALDTYGNGTDVTTGAYGALRSDADTPRMGMGSTIYSAVGAGRMDCYGSAGGRVCNGNLGHQLQCGQG